MPGIFNNNTLFMQSTYKQKGDAVILPPFLKFYLVIKIMVYPTIHEYLLHLNRRKGMQRLQLCKRHR